MIPDINLLPRIGQRETSFKLAYSIVAIIALIVAALLVWQLIHTQNSIKQLTRQQSQLLEQKEQLRQVSTTVQIAERNEYQTALWVMNAISYPVSPLMKEMSRLLVPNTYLRQYTFGKNDLNVIVNYESISDIYKHVANLEGSKYFLDVEVQYIRELGLNGNTNTKQNSGDGLQFQYLPRYEAAITMDIDRDHLMVTRGSN